MPAPTRFVTVATLATALVFAACTNAHVRSGPTNRVDPFGSVTRTPREPGSTELRTPSSTSRICRADPLPFGWIAVDYYEPDEKTCPSPVDTKVENKVHYRAATIVRYDVVPVSGTLEVCWDQTVPRNWHREGEARTSKCPRDGADSTKSPTVMLLRRDR